MAWLRVSWPYVALWVALGTVYTAVQAALLWWIVGRPLWRLVARLEGSP